MVDLIPKIWKLFGHFVERQKWHILANFEGIGRAGHVQVDFDEYGGFPNFDIQPP